MNSYIRCSFLPLVWVYILKLGISNLEATSHLCTDLFSNSSEISPISNPKKSYGYTLQKKSDLSPRAPLWDKLKESLLRYVEQIVHPLETAGLNPDNIADAYRRMSLELPILKELSHVFNEIGQGHSLPHANFVLLKRAAANRIIAISKKPKSHLQVFAALEALRLLTLIETRVEFPRSKEKIEADKHSESELQPQKKKENNLNNSSEQPPIWNKITDNYSPENKNFPLNSEQDDSFHILLTNANLQSNFLRQVIYDLVDPNDGFVRAPQSRKPIQAEKKFSKKLIIYPLNETSIDVPVPYGYTLIPGRYPDHQIVEVGPGEFKVVVNSKDPIVLGLARIQSEVAYPLPPKKTIDPSLWPEDLLLFTLSLKGLPPIQAAEKLAKYISEEGEFFYYAKGGEISDLTAVDQRFQELLSQQIPKVVAMAHVRFFNCDGGAWIGALLLRDILNLQVRVVGGRTSSGIKTVEHEKFHFVTSSSLAHAWVEVFDGTQWVPFDMTPTRNRPENQTTVPYSGGEGSKPPELPQPKKESSESDNDETGQRKDVKESLQDKKTDDTPKGDHKSLEKTEERREKDHEAQESIDTIKDLENFINARSTRRKGDEQNLSLVDRVLKRTELVLLENLIYEGHKTSLKVGIDQALEAFERDPRWKNLVERTKNKLNTWMYEAKFLEFEGLKSFLGSTRVELVQNRIAAAVKKINFLQRLLIELPEYRSLTQEELEAIKASKDILRILDKIKHKNSQEFELVQNLLNNLPGNISKSWIEKIYGPGFDQLGSQGNIQLAKDLKRGSLDSKRLLQMVYVGSFLKKITLNSSEEPGSSEQRTFQRSPSPNNKLSEIITKKVHDYPRFIWETPRPGDNLFAPLIQGRQYAMGSPETREVPDPKNPVERKITVIYYDVSGSMLGEKMETQESLLMAFVDKALSEADSIGRPIHEVYLIPFNDQIIEGIHISSREDALAFISKRMEAKIRADGGTDIQKTVEHFYDLIKESYKKKLLEGREKLFQKANGVFFTDGESPINEEKLKEKRRAIPDDVFISMHYFSIGDYDNPELFDLAKNSQLSSGNSHFTKIDSSIINNIQNVSAQFKEDAFATDQPISAEMMAEIDRHLPKVWVDTRTKTDPSKIKKALSQIHVTVEDVKELSNLNPPQNLVGLRESLCKVELPLDLRRALVETIVDSYPSLSGRNWEQMTLIEKNAFEHLINWEGKISH